MESDIYTAEQCVEVMKNEDAKYTHIMYNSKVNICVLCENVDGLIKTRSEYSIYKRSSCGENAIDQKCVAKSLEDEIKNM